MQSKGLGAEITVSCMVQSGLAHVLTHAVLQHALIIGQHISGTQAHCPVWATPSVSELLAAIYFRPQS